jgi:hypothetical protein
MTATVAAPWKLHCAWCSFYLYVGARGMRGNDPGAGVEAANLMRDHIETEHDQTWPVYLRSLDLPRNSEQTPEPSPREQ